MQSPMFVFVGLRKNKTEDDLKVFSEKLKQSFEGKNLQIHLVMKGELLSATVENASYYMSFIKKKKEMNDWWQMTEDFELEGSSTPVSVNEFVERNDYKRIQHPGLYQELHYSIGNIIFEEMNSFAGTEIYFFQ